MRKSMHLHTVQSSHSLDNSVRSSTLTSTPTQSPPWPFFWCADSSHNSTYSSTLASTPAITALTILDVQTVITTVHIAAHSPQHPHIDYLGCSSDVQTVLTTVYITAHSPQHPHTDCLGCSSDVQTVVTTQSVTISRDIVLQRPTQIRQPRQEVFNIVQFGCLHVVCLNTAQPGCFGTWSSLSLWLSLNAA